MKRMAMCNDSFINKIILNKFKHSEGHFTHEPRAVTMRLWESKRKCPKAVPTHPQNHVVQLRTLKCSVKPYVTGPQPNAISMSFYSCRSSHMIRLNKSTVVSIRSATVSHFCGRPTSKRWFLKIVQVTMKHDPFDAI